MQIKITKIFAVTAGLMISGCAVGPDYQRPEVEVKEQWSESGATELMETLPGAPASWWQVFGDPLLNELVNEAYRENLDVEVAGLRIIEARAALGIALGNRFPQEQAIRGGAVRTGVSENTANFLPFGDTRYWNADLGFEGPVPTWCRGGAGRSGRFAGRL
jgi:outer membrane protein TolC